MLAFPFAKINLGLQVIERRADGYHAIQSVLVPVPLRDALEVVVDPSLSPEQPVLVRTGIAVPGAVEDDLCLKAVHALRKLRKLRPLPGLRLHLHKAIPIGAGLGGGSSDGAHVLLLLNDLLSLDLSPFELQGLAAGLGSDCPFFLQAAPQLAEGRGEQLRPLSLDLQGLWLVLVTPMIHVSTAEAYRGTTPTGRAVDLPALLNTPLEDWQSTVVNTMEPAVFAAHPAIMAIKEQLLAAGAGYAAMSGSGSSVFGLFRQEPSLPAFPTPARSWKFRL